MLQFSIPKSLKKDMTYTFCPGCDHGVAIRLMAELIDEFDLKVAALLSPSKASPPLKEPSPISAITLPSSFFRSRAFATPQAKLTEVDVCPILNKSCSHSSGAV